MAEDKQRNPRPFHPILFAVFPVVSLIANNIDLAPFKDAARCFVVIPAGTIVIWLLLRIVVRHSGKSAMLVSLFLGAFFSYGGYTLSDWQMFPIIILFAGLVVLLAKSQHDFHGATRFMNSAAMISLAIPTSMIAFHLATDPFVNISDDDSKITPIEMTAKMKLRKGQTPDIYYIILDGYGRQDVLQEYYQFDNTPFLDFLRGQGFYVAEKARANYCQTLLSLGSSLNYSYLDSFIDHNDQRESGDRGAVRWAVAHNRVFQFLELFDYDIVSFSTGYSGTEFTDADRYIQPRLAFTEFEYVLMRYTPLLKIFSLSKSRFTYGLHRRRIHFSFDKLMDVPDMASPKFVFAHFISPHPPFVFSKNGDPIDPTENYFSFHDGSHFVNREITQPQYWKRYAEQLQYLNTKLREAIETIRRKSPGAIIVVQSDHGPGSMLSWESMEETNLKERMGILNAYYLPDSGEDLLWQDISPVNTFRIIFNRYFGADIPYLYDFSYYSLWLKPYQFMRLEAE